MSEQEQNNRINQLRRQLIESDGRISEAFSVLEEHIDERFDHVDSRFDRVESRLDRMEHQFNQLQAKLEVIVLRKRQKAKGKSQK